MPWDTFIQLAAILVPLAAQRLWSGRNDRVRAELERIASAAADGVLLSVKHGLVGPHADLVVVWRQRVLELAALAGLRLTPQLEARAQVVASEKLGALAIQHELARLAVAADSLSRVADRALAGR